jgi:hypothetical protein
MFVLAVAVCAFTAAGHDSPAAIAEWATGCSQPTLAALDERRDPWAGRIRPPGARTFSRVYGGIDAEAFNVACAAPACAGRKVGYGLDLGF